MKIASWNINGIKARLDNLLNWLAESQPDIACLQEVKSVDENFPREPIEALGYHVETHGQKGFNGVALLSKMRSDEINRGLPMLPGSQIEDEQARFIEGVYSVKSGVIRVVSLYLKKAARLCGAWKISASRKPFETPRMQSRSIHSGIIRPVPGQRTTAFALTT